MKANLRLRKVANLRGGTRGKEIPAWYNVDGLPKNQWALIQSGGGPESKEQWRIKTNMPSVAQEAKNRTFATLEDALAALQKEIG
jgi:hypothetical protein